MNKIVIHSFIQELRHLLHNPNVLIAISKGMRTVQLCTNKILQFLTRRCQLMQIDLYDGHKRVVAVVVSSVIMGDKEK